MALKVGDKVRNVKAWDEHGVLTKIDGTQPRPYRVHWDKGGSTWNTQWDIKKIK